MALVGQLPHAHGYPVTMADPPSPLVGFRGTLLSHQEAGVSFMAHRELQCSPAGGLLADEPGLGKTVMTTALMLRNPAGFPCLVVCSKALQSQWVAEVLRFSGIQATVLGGGAKGLFSAHSAGSPPQPLWQVGILSYSLLARSTASPVVAALVTGPCLGRIVFDEGHIMRNTSSKAYKVAMELKARHKWILSGTPVVNHMADMWALLQVLGFVPRLQPAPVRPSVMQRMLGQAMLRRTGSDVLDGLPEMSSLLERVEFDSQEEASMYATVEAYCRTKAWRAKLSGNNVAVMEALVRCRQMTVHPELVIRAVHKQSVHHSRPHALSADLPQTWPFMSTKLRVVTELVRQHCANEKVLVFCSFIEEMKLIQAVLGQHGVQALLYNGQISAQGRDATVAHFQDKDSEARVLIVQLQAGGTGLNLQAASRVVISSLPWTPSLESQGIHRAFRLGQTRPVTVHRVAISHTIDDRILRAQQRKAGESSKLLGPSHMPA